jgi:hypothetical protein
VADVRLESLTKRPRARLSLVLLDPDAPSELLAKLSSNDVSSEILEWQWREVAAELEHGNRCAGVLTGGLWACHESPSAGVVQLPEGGVPLDCVGDWPDRDQVGVATEAVLDDGEKCALPRARLAGDDVQLSGREVQPPGATIGGVEDEGKELHGTRVPRRGRRTRSPAARSSSTICRRIRLEPRSAVPRCP